eukprot:3211846-Rhodomonas_salina.3
MPTTQLHTRQCCLENKGSDTSTHMILLSRMPRAAHLRRVDLRIRTKCTLVKISGPPHHP